MISSAMESAHNGSMDWTEIIMVIMLAKPQVRTQIQATGRKKAPHIGSLCLIVVEHKSNGHSAHKLAYMHTQIGFMYRDRRFIAS